MRSQLRSSSRLSGVTFGTHCLESSLVQVHGGAFRRAWLSTWRGLPRVRGPACGCGCVPGVRLTVSPASWRREPRWFSWALLSKRHSRSPFSVSTVSRVCCICGSAVVFGSGLGVQAFLLVGTPLVLGVLSPVRLLGLLHVVLVVGHAVGHVLDRILVVRCRVGFLGLLLVDLVVGLDVG